MLKLCFNATTLRHYDILDACRMIREAGYEAVEISYNDTHIHPLMPSAKRAKEVREFCEEIGLKIASAAAGGPKLISQFDYEPSLICSSACGRAVRKEFIKRSIDLSQELSAPLLNINTGILREDVHPRMAEEYFCEAIEELLDYVKGSDTILVLEQEPNFFVGIVDFALRYIRKFDNPQLRFNLDIGHVFCSEPDAVCYENIEKALPYSAHLHVEDIKDKLHRHEIPGEGDIDWKRILALIDASGFDGYTSVELHHHDQMVDRALKESRDYLLALSKKQ